VTDLALETLRALWPTATLTGSSNPDDPEIICRGARPVTILVTWEPGVNRSLMFHLPAEDFLAIAALGVGDTGLAASVRKEPNDLHHDLKNRAESAWKRWWSGTGETSEARTIVQMQREARGA